MHNVPPQRNGKIINDKYIWNNSKELPSYFNSGLEFMKVSIPLNDHTIKHNFYFSDSEEDYKKKLRKQDKDWHYRKKEVTYTLNSSGYRTYEFDDISWKDSIVIFGCSCVFGVGVSDDETLNYYLEKYLDRPVINMGVPGCSNQFISDSISILNKKYGMPYGLIVMWTTTDRMPYYGKEFIEYIGPWSNNKKTHESKIYEYIYEDDSHEFITFYNIANISRNAWQDKTRYYDASFFEYVSHYGELKQFFPFSNTARDLFHPGHSDFKLVADEIKNFFK